MPSRRNFCVIPPIALSAMFGFGSVYAQLVYMPPTTQYEPATDKEINVPALTEQEESAFIKRLKAAQNAAAQTATPRPATASPPATTASPPVPIPAANAPAAPSATAPAASPPVAGSAATTVK